MSLSTILWYREINSSTSPQEDFMDTTLLRVIIGAVTFFSACTIDQIESPPVESAPTTTMPDQAEPVEGTVLFESASTPEETALELRREQLHLREKPPSIKSRRTFDWVYSPPPDTSEDPVCDDTEVCWDGIDNNCDGEIDEGCCLEDADCSEDGDMCTSMVCLPDTGRCIATPVDCDDGDPCTADLCDPDVGCVSTPDPALCFSDEDEDGIADSQDNCPHAWNPLQTDDDGNGKGDICEDSRLCYGRCIGDQRCIAGLCLDPGQEIWCVEAPCTSDTLSFTMWLYSFWPSMPRGQCGESSEYWCCKAPFPIFQGRPEECLEPPFDPYHN